MKHVSIDRHYIKETLEQNNIRIPYIQSAEQRADVLTKGLPKEHFMKLRSKLGLMDIHSSAWGEVSEDRDLDVIRHKLPL